MVTCYLTPSLEATIVSPDAIGHEFQCRGYTSVSNFDGVGCSLTLRHCRYASQDARFPLLLVQGLLYTEPLLPPTTDAERTGPMPASLRHHRRLLPMAIPAVKAFDCPSINKTVVDVHQMSLDTGVAVPVVTNVSPADAAVDTDDPDIAGLNDMFPWAITPRCHGGMACQCAAPTSFVDGQLLSAPPDPALDLPPPGVPAQCDCCVDCGDRNHALIFHMSIPCHNGLDNDDYFSIAPVNFHKTLMFQWRIIRRMHSEEAVSQCDATFDRLILHWILSPSPLCFALSSNRQYPQVAEAYLQALFSGGYGYDVIKFGDSLFLHACIKLDDAVSTLHLFALGLPSDVLPRPFLPVNDASKCSSSKCNNNGCCLDKRFARWSRRRSTRLSLKHIIAAITCWLVVAFRDRTFFLLSLTPPRTFKFHSSVCNILLGIHLS
jgi:hypothetical protein